MSLDTSKKLKELHELFEELQYIRPEMCIHISKIAREFINEIDQLKEDKKELLNELLNKPKGTTKLSHSEFLADGSQYKVYRCKKCGREGSNSECVNCKSLSA